MPLTVTGTSTDVDATLICRGFVAIDFTKNQSARQHLLEPTSIA
jgi:hypothetical protein